MKIRTVWEAEQEAEGEVYEQSFGIGTKTGIYMV